MATDRANATEDRRRRPRLGTGIQVHEPAADEAPWVVHRADDSYLRVGADVGRLLQRLDGSRDHRELAEALGSPWTEPDVTQVIERVDEMRLLDGADATPRRRRAATRRIRFVPPLTVQLTLVDPAPFLRRVAPAVGVLTSRRMLWLGVAVAVGGIVALSAQRGTVRAALGEPLPLGVLGAIAVASLVTTGLHELGHGAALTRYGGVPTRMGVMIFYLTPVFFCDVTDGWRLPRREQRTKVALAGAFVQAVVAGAAALLASPVQTWTGSATTRTALLAFAAATYLAAALNLVPLVKFDGYIALMSSLDIPHLRDRSMSDARRAVARVAFGGRYRRELPELPWAPVFGFASAAFPVYLVATAIYLWFDLLQAAGWVGSVVALAILAYLAYRVALGAVRLVREALAAGAARWRVVAVTCLVALAATAGVTLVRVPYDVTGGFVCTDARAELILPDGTDHTEITAGAEVELYQRGLVMTRAIGTAEVAEAPARPATAPLSALYPISGVDEITVDGHGFPLTGCPGLDDDPTTGEAVVTVDERSLGRWLVATYLAPALR